MNMRRGAADGWADECIAKLQRSQPRRARLRAERFIAAPEVITTREYDARTEKLTRFPRVKWHRKDVAWWPEKPL